MVRSLLISIRPLNCAMAAFAALLGRGDGIAAAGNVEAWLCMLTVFLVCAGGNLSNDLTDLANDRLNHPTRPIVSGKLDERTARIGLVAAYALALAISLHVSWPLTMLTVAAIGGLELYNHSFKRIPLAGNLLVSAITASTLFAGALSKDLASVSQSLWVVAGTVFFLNLSREIVKDAADMTGDRAAQIPTLPQLVGVTISLILALSFGLAAVSVGGMLLQFSFLFMLTLVVTIAAAFLYAFGAKSRESFAAAGMALKAAMLAGLIAVAYLQSRG